MFGGLCGWMEEGMKKYSLVLLLIIAAPLSSRELGLAEYLKLATAADVQFHRILQDKLLLQYKEILRMPAKDWTLQALAEHQLDLAQPPLDPNTQWDLSLAKMIPESGTRLALGADGDGNRGSNAVYGWSAEITQDLARNAFGRSGRLDEHLSKIDIEIARYQLIEAYEDYYATISSLYLRWYLAWHSWENARLGWQESEKLLDNVQQRRRKNIALSVDVDFGARAGPGPWPS